jgi:hypothetical protein
MMRRYLTILCLAATLPAGAMAGPIDFTPTEGTRTLEGVVFKQIRFHQDGHVISYDPPRGWTLSGDGGGMRLTPPDISQARVTVEQTPLPAPQAFDEPTVQKLQQVALGEVPSEATNATLLEEEKNPLPIHQHETYGVTVGYNFLGQDYAANLLFVNLGDTQVRFRTIARKADFDQVRRAFRASLFTLAWQ